MKRKKTFMEKVSNKLKIYLYSSLILTGISTVLAALNYIFFFDTAEGYFASSPLLVFLTALFVLCIIWFASTAFLIPKGVLDGAAPTTLTVNVASIPLALVCAGIGIFMIVSSLLLNVSEGGSIFYTFFPSFFNTIPDRTPLLLFCGIFLIISVAYFVMLFISRKTSGDIIALVGFSLPIATLLLTAIAYFDIHMALNSPLKIAFMLSNISFMIFSLYEIRVLLGRPMPRAYLSFGMLAVLLSALASVPQIVAYSLGRFSETRYLVCAVFSLCVFFYTATRLLTFVSARDLLERISDQTPADDEITEEGE